MLDNNWLITSAPLGGYDSKNQSWKAFGSGVFIFDKPFIWYVTANHIVKRKSTLPIHVLINHAKTKYHLINIESMHSQNEIDWIVDEENDLAATLFPLNPDFNIKAIGFPFFQSSQDLLQSMICYTVGCPYGMAGFDIDRNNQYVLDGIISFVERKKNRIYVTVPTFPGNSGGPLFVWKQPIQPDGSLTVGSKVVFLGGIISKYVLISNGSEQDNPCPALPPMHLGEVIPSELIKNLLTSQKSFALKEKVKGKS